MNAKGDKHNWYRCVNAQISALNQCDISTYIISMGEKEYSCKILATDGNKKLPQIVLVMLGVNNFYIAFSES